jgi:threonine synthase
MKMGLPINKLICASNDNNVLTDFISTGTYDTRREFKKTISPSMDILVSSNLERLLYELSGRDSTLIKTWMSKLKNDGVYTVDSNTHKSISSIFWGGYTNEFDTLRTIESIYKDFNYVVDTHTAVGIDVYDKYVISTGDMTRTIIASTASPFKFNDSVVRAIFGEEAIQDKNEFQLLDMLSYKCNMPVPKGLKDLNKKEVRHSRKCKIYEMEQEITEILKI